MFGVGAATRIYLALGSADMRKGANGLSGLVRDPRRCDPLSGHLFLFSNAQRNRLKLIYWDGTGLRVCAKTLQQGRYRWPIASAGQTKVRSVKKSWRCCSAASTLGKPSVEGGIAGLSEKNLKAHNSPHNYCRKRLCIHKRFLRSNTHRE